MPQDSESGGRAARWGRQTARRLADALGVENGFAKMTSNECRIRGERAVVKCAAVNTNSIGVTYAMLQRLEIIVAAFELDDGSFEVWELTPTQFKAAMRPTRSTGPSAGRVGLVRKLTFERYGRALGRVQP